MFPRVIDIKVNATYPCDRPLGTALRGWWPRLLCVTAWISLEAEPCTQKRLHPGRLLHLHITMFVIIEEMCC